MPTSNLIAAIESAVTVAALAASTVAAPPAVVEPHAISRGGQPALRITVPHTAHYVGGDHFTLYGNADCELHLFVEADPQKHIRRYYWIQFEEYLPTNPNDRYTYGEHDQRMMLWGGTTWVGSAFGKTNQPSRQGSDREHADALLKRAGYTIPATVMQVRMVRLLDDAADDGHGRRELMLIYAEDLASSGESYEALGGDGDGTPRWRALQPDLIKRATAVFHVTAR